MLQSLQIKDFILIENLDLDFNEGFCVITGETGAGKSILLDSILFCLGGKIQGNPVRPSANSCSVTLVFDYNRKTAEYLEKFEIEPLENLIIKCTQNSQGRKKFLVNDQVVNIRLIQGLFDYLLELHGQHSHTLLLKTSSHIEILDEFGEFIQLKDDISVIYYKWQKLEHKINDLNASKDQIEQDIDYLTHVCSELEAANVKKGEEQELFDIKRTLLSHDKEKELISAILSDIEQSTIERLIAKAQKSIATLESSVKLEQIETNLETAYDKIEDAKSSLQQILSEIESPAHSIDEIEDRLHEIRSLTRKHSCHCDDLEDLHKKLLNQLSNLESQIKNNTELEKELSVIKQQYFMLADKLSCKRQEVATTLEEKVMNELALLDMKKAVFKVEVESDKKFASSKGIDKIRFLASTNPGMNLSAVDKVASGGELSRFMLALRVALYDNMSKQSIIFDEIDVGISGSVADSVGQRLKILSNAGQIIVITHQPQVAGKADCHVLVAKTQHEKHTIMQVRILDAEQRSYELARMISGKKITETGLRAAKELII
jgi:DNA repair protein RecN (Recombination protein N)